MKHKNNVWLIDHVGGDKHHSLAAWASTFLELNIPMPKKVNLRVDEIVNYILKKSKRMRSVEDLLQYLAAEEHESPFRMSSLIFGMTTDIATHIQKLKHAVILEAENGESAKYKELKEDKFYLPFDWNADKPENLILDYWRGKLKSISEETNELYHQCLKDLRPILGDKRAKETSRYFKMYNSQINTVNKFSFAGVMTLYKKRTVDFAQEEIKEIAKQMVEEIKNIEGNPYKYSLKAFGLSN